MLILHWSKVNLLLQIGSIPLNFPRSRSALTWKEVIRLPNEPDKFWAEDVVNPKYHPLVGSLASGSFHLKFLPVFPDLSVYHNILPYWIPVYSSLQLIPLIFPLLLHVYLKIYLYLPFSVSG